MKATVPSFTSTFLEQHRRSSGCLTAILALLVGITANSLAQTNDAAGFAGKGAGPRLGPIAKVTVTITNHADLERLVQAGYDLERVSGNQATVFADSDELSSLTIAGWQINILQSPPSPSGLTTTKSFGSYNDYTNMTAMLEAYATNYPAMK